MNQKIEYENYLEEVQGLYPMPRIMAEVARRMRSDDTTLDDLCELLMTDTTLVGEIVVLSNSSYFGFAEKSESLSEAMQRIGMRELGRLLGVCMAGQVYQAELQHYRIPPEVFWESGIAAALLMERLADLAGLDPESAYLAGLMRESGMLLLNHALSIENGQAFWDNYLPLHEWEREVTGHDHAEVGAALLRLWGFSDEVWAAVEWQWSGAEPGRDLGSLLDLVNRLLARCGCDFSIPIRGFSEFSGALEALGLDETAVFPAIERAASTFRRLRSGVLEA